MSNYENNGVRKIAAIMSTADKNPNAAKAGLEKFTKKNPYIIWGHIRYASVLITLNELEEAEKELNTASSLIRDLGYSRNKSEVLNNIRNSLLYNRLRLYAFQNKAESFLRLYASHEEELADVKQSNIIYFRSLLGIAPSPEYIMPFCAEQAINYDESKFIESVKNNSCNDYIEEEKREDFAYFKPDFPLEKVVEEVKKHIPSEKRKNGKYITNEYLFKYSECGDKNGSICDYFIVTALNNTDHLISMFPVMEPGDIEYTDLNYLKNKNNVQIKSLSRIDRFNQKYRRINNQ